MGDRHVPSRVLSNGPDIRPDVNVSPNEYVKVEDLPLDDLQDRMKVVGDLWERGILMTSDPLEAKYDDP